MIVSRSCFALALGLAFAAPASAGTSIVVDAASGEVLSSENPTQAWHPASTTKMMTAYLALKAVRERRLGLQTAIPASKRAASQPRVKVYIRAGQEVTLDNALRIMMVKSANDIAYVIAEGVGGDVESFVSMMNAEAQRLGMRDTVFTNPNGWHDPAQQTSARDLAILALALMRDFPDYSDYWNTQAVQLGKQVLQNTNGLVGRYPGVSGMKTGFVCASGFNVVATATRGGRTLIAVVLGSLSGAERTVKAAQLLDEGFGRWSGGGYAVASLSPSGTRAVSICDDVRRKGGGAALADDADIAGPLSGQLVAVGGNADGINDRFGAAAPQASQTSGLLTRAPSGRIVLGPRAQATPVPVAFGRTSGSASAPLAANVVKDPASQIARGEASTIAPSAPVAAGVAGVANARRAAASAGGIPAATSAFAPAGVPTQPAADAFRSGPLQLSGSVQPGTATPSSLRPGAAAGIRPAAKPAARPPLVKPKDSASKAAESKPGAGKPAAGKAATAKPPAPQAKASTEAAARSLPPARPKPAAKPKPKTDDGA